MKRSSTIAANHQIFFWVAVSIMTVFVLLLFGSGLGGADDRVPATLSDDIVKDAQPMPPSTYAESPEFYAPPAADITMLVWQALDHHSHGEWAEALDIWYSLQLAPNTQQWRQIAIAQAHLALGDYDEAAGALNAAEDLEPDNAAMHYFRGLLRLEQVPQAMDWYDAQPSRASYVAYRPTDVVPNSKAMYRYVARLELQRAIKFADTVELDQPLLPELWQSTVDFGPTVEDLLIATGADNFPARAHNVLGKLLLEEGALDEAEHHIDHAAKAGMFVSYNYVDLIDEFENRGYYLDAARVCAKAVGHGLDEQAAHQRAMENVRREFGW